jgi:hypothetical protein
LNLPRKRIIKKIIRVIEALIRAIRVPVFLFCYMYPLWYEILHDAFVDVSGWRSICASMAPSRQTPWFRMTGAGLENMVLRFRHIGTLLRSTLTLPTLTFILVNWWLRLRSATGYWVMNLPRKRIIKKNLRN